MQLSNYINVFKNYFTSKDIENSLLDIKLKFNNIQLKFLENFNFDPIYFVYSFYNFILLNKRIPLQDEFVKFYIKENLEDLKNGFIKKGLEYSNSKNLNYTTKDLIYYLVWRLRKVYPSYIRDVHFSMLLYENLNKDVFYNPELDVKEGIDILIDNKYKINLYIDTVNSNFFRNKKYKRHIINENLIDINIPLNFNKALKIGDFYLYSMNEVNLIKQEIFKND